MILWVYTISLKTVRNTILIVKSLSQVAYDGILNLILTGKYRPGYPLKEDELATELGISRTPIREALARLEREGIILKSGRSYVVIPMTKEDVVQLYEVRIPLEAEAARLASVRASPQEIEEIMKVIDSIKKAKGVDDPLELASLNGRFHELVVAASHNKYLEEILRNVRTRLKIVRVTLFTGSQRKEEEVKEHEEISIAIKERKAEEAYAKMKEHEENVLRFVKETVLPLLFS